MRSPRRRIIPFVINSEACRAENRPNEFLGRKVFLAVIIPQTPLAQGLEKLIVFKAWNSFLFALVKYIRKSNQDTSKFWIRA